MKELPDIEWKDLRPAAAGLPAEPFAPPAATPAWDAQPLPQVRLADLDGAALAGFRERLGEGAAAGDAALLEQLQLFQLKRAAVLLFHAAPERLVSGAYVRLGRFDREQRLIEQHAIGGPLFVQFERTLALLEEHLQRSVTGGREARSPADYPLPLAALREALLNALLHKDYARGLPIQIRLHDGRISLWNPAQLPAGWSAGGLRERQLARPGNPDIAAAFQRAGLVEGWGLGIDKLLAACRAHGVAEPLLRPEQDGLWLEFAFARALPRQATRGAADRPAARGAGEVGKPSTGHAAGHVTGHAAGEVAGHVTGEVEDSPTGEVAGEVTGHVASEVARLVQACDGVMTRKALQKALGLKSDANFRTLYLVPALEAGLIEMTIPDKPKSSRQQYRLSSAGQALRQARRRGK